MKRHSLHSHTTYSDGELTPIGLLAKAKIEGLQILGISDHAFAGKLQDDRQITNKLDIYLDELNGLKTSFQDIDLLIGAEIECDTSSLHPSQLPFDILNEFDYLLFEYINDEFGGRDISEIVQIRNKLQIPIGLAHNDLQRNFEGRENEIAKILSDNDIFIEICQSEGRRNSRLAIIDDLEQRLDYYKLFSKKLIEALSKWQVKVVIGTDTHYGDAVSEINDAYQFILSNNLTPHNFIQ